MVGLLRFCLWQQAQYPLAVSSVRASRKAVLLGGAHLPPTHPLFSNWKFRNVQWMVTTRSRRRRVRESRCETVKEEEEDSSRTAGVVGASPIQLLLVSDLDSTMVDHTDPYHTALLRFNNLWAAEYAHNSLLVFSTGRSPHKYEELHQQVPLLTPSIGIFSVGTEILYGSSLEPDQGWVSLLDDGWDRDVALKELQRFTNLRMQDASEQRPHKISCQVDSKDAQDIMKKLSERLQDCGLKVKVVFSHGIDLDVLPQRAGKGEALAYLLHKMRSKGQIPQNTLVCGDSGNDIELFLVEGVHGVIVGNALPELVEWYKEHGKNKDKIFQATERCASGILQSLQHFSLGPHLSPRDRMGLNGIDLPILSSESRNGWPAMHGCAQREVVEFNTLFEKWINAEVPNNAETFQRLTRVIARGSTMVYPWGVEQSLLDSVSSAQPKYGIMKDNKLRTWIDCIQEQKLADEIFLVTWHSWQISAGGEKKGYFATAILRTKEGMPNGVEWVRVHETARK
ncbi:unnamed protein product [Sphagnum balticum]